MHLISNLSKMLPSDPVVKKKRKLVKNREC